MTSLLETWCQVRADTDHAHLRGVLGSFLTGVTVVTAWDGQGQARGFTANSFTSVSLEPALILVCIAKSAYGLSVFSEAAYFAVNILTAEQQALSKRFASQSPDKFTGVDLCLEQTYAPCLQESLSVLCCKTYQQLDAGDHRILLGQVQSYRQSTKPPLAYFRGRYLELRT